MSAELVPIDGSIAEADDRQRSLAELNSAAENASTPQDAHEIMVKGKTLASLLAQVKAPFEDARLAGKASVIAAKRLSRMLAELPSDHRPHRGRGAQGTSQSRSPECASRRLRTEVPRTHGRGSKEVRRQDRRTAAGTRPHRAPRMSILLRIRHQDEAERQAKIMAELALMADDDTPMRVTGATPAGDERRLRGIPAIGRGVAGAVVGSRPGCNLR